MTTTIELAELRDMIRDGNVALVEALPETHFAAGHLPGAVSLPLDRLAQAHERLPDREADIVVYCASETCKNSDQAAVALASMGYRSVRVYKGGKAEWKGAGLALEVAP